MNIFVLDLDPQIAATYHCNKHVVKMVTESAQLLSTSVRHHYPSLILNKHWLYKPTHPHHPCTKWLGESLANFGWLNDLLGALIMEYDFRFGKPNKFLIARTIHDTLSLVLANKDMGNITVRPLCMPDEYQLIGDPVVSYHAYYNGDKRHLHKWTKRETPKFITQ